MCPDLTTPSFLVFGLSHKTAPLAVREKLALSDTKLDQLHRNLLEGSPLNGLMVLSTCNRVEVYGVSSRIEQVHEVLRSDFGQRIASDMSADPFYWQVGAPAIEHLVRVTSGLDSMILGEPQIAGQVKEAYSRAIQQGTSHALLNQVTHRAFRIAKKVRTETDIQRQPVSVPYTAVLLAEQIFGELASKRVLLVGAGQMSELAARHFTERRIEKLTIANRDLERAQGLAEQFSGAVPSEALDLETLGEQLHESDIVVTSTSSPDVLIQLSQVREAMRRRKNRPMFFIDLGVPRDVASEVNDIANAYLFDIDDLQQVVDGNLEERRRAALQAEKIIREEVGHFNGYLAERDLTPVIRELMSRTEALQQDEFEKLYRRLPKLNDEEREAIEGATAGMIKKLLHPTLDWLKDADADHHKDDKAALIRRLFRLR